MKYLWLTFIVCVVGLILQVRLGEPPKNAYVDGQLACQPVPPRVTRAQPPLLPPPVLQRIPPLQQPARVQATSIEIFDYNPEIGLAETLHADKVDWGIARSLPSDSPVDLAYAVEPRLVEPVPVNVPPPASAGPAVVDFLTSDAVAWSPTLERWSSQTLLVGLVTGTRGKTIPRLDDLPVAVADNNSSPAANESGMAFYLPPEKVETASLAPRELITPPTQSGPNLYLPEGALDEEGAMLTLIKPELRLFEVPAESSAWTGQVLKSGEKVRPLTRLRNAEGFDWIKFNRKGKSYWAQAEFFIRVDPRNRRQSPEGNLPVGEEKVDKDSALPVDYHPDDLVRLDQKYVFGAKHVQMRKEAAEAFEKMAAAAERKGLHIRAFSGFRDFAYQKNLYLQAVDKNGPKQDGTAAPGYSEHQLGTTADICGENRRTILSGRFGETPEGRWLHENSEKYGFRKSYTRENSEEVGYKPEPWHFRYIGIAQNSVSRDIANK